MGEKPSKHRHRHDSDDVQRVIVARPYNRTTTNTVQRAESNANITAGAKNVNDRLQYINNSGYHERIEIENDSIGHGYQSLFGKYLDRSVTKVWVQDPYIRKHHQCVNFLRLSELLVRSCPMLAAIHLETVFEPDSEQAKSLAQLKSQLANRQILLAVTYSTTLHDRQITLNNGYIIKIGRGLDYFKPSGGKFCLGNFDLELRPCHQTTVDVFR